MEFVDNIFLPLHPLLPSPGHSLIFPNYEVSRHLKGRIKVLRENAEKERLQSLYKVEDRNNNVLRRKRGCEFGVNLAENVEAASRNITIPVTLLDFLQYAGRERDRGSSKGSSR